MLSDGQHRVVGAVLPDGPSLWFQKGAVAGSEQSLICSFLQLLGDKWGKSGSRGWCVIPRDDPLVLYVYAAPQVTPLPAPPRSMYVCQQGGEGESRWSHKSDGETEAW